MSARNVEQEFDLLRSDFSKLACDIASLTETLSELGGQNAKDGLAKLRATMNRANEDVGAAADALGARSREGMAAASHLARQHPLAGILICFGLGVVLGKMIDR